MTQPGFESPKTAAALTPPQTRVLQAWREAWHGVFKDGRRKIVRTNVYSDAIRRIK